MYITLAVMSFASVAQSQDLMGFDRASYGSVVLSQTQSAGTDVQLELSIGNYENEPIINYSVGSVFAQIGRSVGRLDVLTDKGMFPCTAFIVSKQYILTNYHCSLGLLDNEKIGATRIDATQFVAGYTQTGIDEGTKKYTVIPTPVETSKSLDYAVLEVIGDPSQEYGQLKLSSILPNSGDPFWIIGHPMGEGQRISREKCKANNPALSSGKLLHTCDTLPGNSGSPVIDAGLQQVVALHHAGSKADSVNFAILMSEILANSKVLTAYNAPKILSDVNPKPIKTVETTACDALYSEAKEAKACFAYDVYIKSCSAHILAPMALGYVKEFCRPQEVVKEDSALNAPPAAKKACSIVSLSNCDDEEICAEFKTSAEAKRRGLACGVQKIPQKTPFDKKNTNDVRLLQNSLNSAGCDAGYADGVWGKQTASAVLQFGKTAGLSTSNKHLVSEEILNALSKAKTGFCPQPKLSSYWIFKNSCENLKQPNIAYLKFKKSSDSVYTYTNPQDSSAKGSFEIIGNRIKAFDTTDRQFLMEGEISADKKRIIVSGNLKHLKLGKCTAEGRAVTSNFIYKPINSGLNYSKKMIGTAECKKNMKSQTVSVKAFNAFWPDQSSEYLTTRYHLNNEGLTYTYRFSCSNGSCMNKRYSDVEFKKGEISFKFKSKIWGQCKILIK